jgi:hypothetical protein
MPPARKTTRKKHSRPVIVSRNRVRRRGGRLSRPLLWQGRQWAVTGYGVEARDGSYPIRKERLGELTWDEHMADKGWVDMADFRAAIAWARDYFDVPAPAQEEIPDPAVTSEPAEAADEFRKPTPGVFHLVDGHIYRHLDEHVVEAGGRKHLMLRLLGKCEACGAPFGVEAPLDAFEDGLPKHCDSCSPKPPAPASTGASKLAEMMA